MITNAEINQRLAAALGLDLGARADGKNDYHIAGRWLVTVDDHSGMCEAVRLHNQKNPYDARMDLIEFVWQKREGQPWRESIETFHAAWRKQPPDYCGSLDVAFGLGEEMRKRDLQGVFLINLGKVQNYTFDHFKLCHASARDRAMAAILAMGGSLDE